ncbi:hypothetical protein RhiirC2_800817 [Rhizophagus irregularis]|uniref:Uncharacterized protein n=1 Tax=Rhizophagus irregularis TaxID=588596 RepID=A0A2N1M362_9GLOM|nr:hypothetical protein RhiirC2_800817 [Rhizophagus irregularis]
MTRRRDDVTNSMKRLKRHTDQKSRVVVLDATTVTYYEYLCVCGTIQFSYYYNYLSSNLKI